MGVTINKESTTNEQQQNHRIRTDISQSHWGAQMHFTRTKFAVDSSIVDDQKC